MCILWFHESKSVVTVQRRFHLEYSNRRPPSKDTIKCWYQQFKDTGNVEHRKGTGRPSTSTEDVDHVWEAFMRNPSTLTCRASLQLGISRTTVMRILHKRLKLHPYKVQLLHELKPNDKPKHFDFAMHILNKIDEDNSYLENVIISNEATFHVSGYVNRHNCRIWGTEPPHAVREKAHSSPKVNVWCALAADEIFGPFFFIEQTVTSVTYLDML